MSERMSEGTPERMSEGTPERMSEGTSEPMSPRDRRYLFLQVGLGSAIVNVFINGGLGWAGVRIFGADGLRVWRIPGVAPDLLGTAFGVTFGTCLGMAFQVPRDLKSGKIGHVALPPALAGLIARFPEGTFKRSIVLGALSVPVFAIPVVVTIGALGISTLSAVSYIVIKATLASFDAAVVAPFIVLGVLADLRRREFLTGKS